MASDLYRASLTNNAQGAANPAIVDFSVVSGGATEAEVAAGILAYFYALGLQDTFGTNAAVTGITKRLSGASGSTPVPFPTTEYATLKTANGADLPTLTAYNTVLGGTEAYAPLGTSITVSLYTATPGRKTTGRHYIPWVSQDTNDGNGRVASGYLALIVDAYTAFLLGVTSGTFVGVVDVSPSVQSATAGTNLITTPVASSSFARLKTRSR